MASSNLDTELEHQSGFGKVAHVPVIFDPEPGYARLPNRFLIDRALGAWDPRWRGARPSSQTLSELSLKSFGYWLCNALEWAQVRGIDLMTADYTSVLVSQYQEEMLNGTWSAGDAPLAVNTASARVKIALEYQMWCADKGHRAPFPIPIIPHCYSATQPEQGANGCPDTAAKTHGKGRNRF